MTTKRIHLRGEEHILKSAIGGYYWQAERLFIVKEGPLWHATYGETSLPVQVPAQGLTALIVALANRRVGWKP